MSRLNEGGRTSNAPWWRSAVFYEIVTPSFQDSNGDGIGDLPGVTRRLPYLKDLGVGAVWLSPFYESPFYDLGYDVSDYCRVDPRFGTEADFAELIGTAHDLGLKVVVDYVPNHTSHEHPWFLESRRSRTSSKRDWYLWHDPVNGGPPNNWINRFGDSAWTFDEETGQYYFGTFTPEQPDLNWRNPEVRAAMYDVIRYWLRLGVDGLRVDALAHLLKDVHLRNNPVNEYYNESMEPPNRLDPVFSQNHPELLKLIGEMKQVINEFPDRAFIGEVYQPPEQIAAYQWAGADVLLNTTHLQGVFQAIPIEHQLSRQEALTPAGCWPAYASGNHDISRLGSRVVPANLRLAAMLHFCLRGTATMYYGEELGLTDAELRPEDLLDPSGRQDPRYGRDPYRTPMPWRNEPLGGFTTGRPWLPLAPQHLELSVESQRQDPGSLLNFYRKLLKVRSEEPALRLGDYRPLLAPETAYVFSRGVDGSELVVALNFADEPAAIRVPSPATIIFSSIDEQTPSPDSEGRLHLRPLEGVIARTERCGE